MVLVLVEVSARIADLVTDCPGVVGETLDEVFIGAAGRYALEHHVERLAEDHENARRLAEALAGLPGIALDLSKVETNMVFFELTRPGLNAFTYAKRLKALGVLVNPLDQSRIRAVTHLDISPQDIAAAIPLFLQALPD